MPLIRPAPSCFRTSAAAATSSSTTRTGSGCRPRPITSSSSASRPDGSTLTKTGDYDLTGVVDPASERITSALPDFRGLIWFVTKQNGKVGTLNPSTGAIRVRTLGQEIENSFAVGQAGRLHRLGPAHVPLRRREERRSEDHLEGRLQELRDRQARPGRRRQRYHSDGHAGRLRRDHRQRASRCTWSSIEPRRSSTTSDAPSARSRSSASTPATPRTRCSAPGAR